MDFAKMLHAAMESYSHHKRGDLLAYLRILCGRIWDVFAHGVRLERHDSYYDDRMDIWRKEYFEAVGKLDGDIRAQMSVFDGIIRDNIRLASEIEAVPEGPAAKDLAPITPDSILNPRRPTMPDPRPINP